MAESGGGIQNFIPRKKLNNNNKIHDDRIRRQKAIKQNIHSRGVDKFFKTLAKLASGLVFSLAKSEFNRLNI
jgi:hypothetical protein